MITFLRKPAVRVLACILLGIMLILSYKMREYFTMTEVTLVYKHDLFPSVCQYLLHRIGYLLISVLISVTLISIMPDRKTVFTKMGTHSIYIFVLHNYILALFYYLNRKLQFVSKVNTTKEYVLFIFLCFVVCILLINDKVEEKTKWLVEPHRYIDLCKYLKDRASNDQT